MLSLANRMKIHKYSKKMEYLDEKQQIYKNKLQMYSGNQLGGKRVDGLKEKEVIIKMLQNDVTHKDFIIVGGGPVGLHTAYELLKNINSAESKIYLFEKRLATRQQILWVDAKFWDSLPPEVKNYVQEHNGLCLYKKSSSESDKKNPIRCYNANGEVLLSSDQYYANIKLDTLQNALETYMLNRYPSNFILVINFEVSAYLLETCKCNNILICDGGGPVSKEIIREKIELNISYAMVITFTCKLKCTEDQSCDSERFDQIVYEALYNSSHDEKIQKSVITYLSKNNESINGVHHAYIGIQLSETTHEAFKTYVQQHTDKNNIISNTRERMQYFTDNFPEGTLYAYVVDKLYNEVDIPEKGGISIFPITLQSAKEFYVRSNNKYYFLIGDSAFTTHFFTGTGMNRGFASSKLLTKILADYTFNREFLATIYSLSQKATRNKLWGDIIPPYLHDMAKTLDECKLETGTERADCIMKNSVKKEYNTPGEKLKEFVDSHLKEEPAIYIQLLTSATEKAEELCYAFMEPVRPPLGRVPSNISLDIANESTREQEYFNTLKKYSNKPPNKIEFQYFNKP